MIAEPAQRAHGLEALRRIEQALAAATEVLRALTPADLDIEHKTGGGPVCRADRMVDDLLRRRLPGADEGWLSEESKDDANRLSKGRVWIVDPLDGTREFLEGVPECVVSIGLVEDGLAVAGGIANPRTGEIFLGAVGIGVTYNGRPARVSGRQSLEGALVLASRTELARGDWDRCRGRSFAVKPVGSVAYKLALVAAGLADATWTLAPKNEWDVAAGVALVSAAGGTVSTLEGAQPVFNKMPPVLSGLAACTPDLSGSVRREIAALS